MIQIKKKTRNILLIVIGVIILILVALPTIIKSYVVNNSKELIGRKIEIGNLKYNYFSSTVQVYDFKMFEQNEQDEFTTFDTLILNLEPYRIISNEKVIEQFHIGGLMVKTVLKDSTFNFDDLIAFHSSETDSIAEPEEDVFKYEIFNIELNNANFFFNNENVNKETHIEDLSFIIPFIGWDQEEKSNADVKFNFKNGGYFQSSLNINAANGEFDAYITLKDLYLKPFYEYVREYAEINDFNGQLNSQIEIRGNTNEAINSIVSGHVDVHDFIMTDKNDKAFLKANRIDCNLKSIDYANSSYVLDSLKLYQPFAYFEMDSITNNFFKIFKLDPNGDPIPDKSGVEQSTDSISDSDLYYAIKNLIVEDGILDYSDNLTGEPFNYHLSEIKIDSKDIVSDADWIDIYSTMLLNNRGTLQAKLGYNPNDYTNLNLDMTVENFLLSDLNIYSNYYVGHNILKGDFYYYAKSIITNGDIVSENQLLIKNVTLENNKGGLFSLPLKFALFLLKDKNGDVNLNVPVRGDLNDPSISIGKIVWTTIKNKITGAVASPINSLAPLVDIDPKDYEELKFTFTDTVPSSEHMVKLNKLLELESEKDGLQIDLIQFIDPNLQREAIALSELGKQYYKKTKKDYLKDEKDFKVYLQKKVGNDTINLKDAAFQLIKQQTTDSLAAIYNEALIKNTSEYLKTTKAETHIAVFKSDLKEPDNIGSLNRLKIKFDLFEDQSVKTDTISNNY